MKFGSEAAVFSVLVRKGCDLRELITKFRTHLYTTAYQNRKNMLVEGAGSTDSEINPFVSNASM
jgi:hypothetical protein